MANYDLICLLCMNELGEPRKYPCPICGGDDRKLAIKSPALPPRTLLDNRYLIGESLGQGGFGITYKAYDLRMAKPVAIKEYFPSSIVGRDSTAGVSVYVNTVKGERAKDEYNGGLDRFLNEARRQSRLASSPGVVSVTDFFQANNTAYYCMEFVDGHSLAQEVTQPISIQKAIELLNPIANSLISIHKAGLIHRDISPDNIMYSKNGEGKLLDFGASHSFVEEESTASNGTLKHGFAPPEQYGTTSLQGTWTDVYGFTATLYWCITGKIPQDSMDRSIGGDKLIRPSFLGAVLSDEIEDIIARGMSLTIKDRYQTIESFWRDLKNAVADMETLNNSNDLDDDVKIALPVRKTQKVNAVKITDDVEIFEPSEHIKIPKTPKIPKISDSVELPNSKTVKVDKIELAELEQSEKSNPDNQAINLDENIIVFSENNNINNNNINEVSDIDNKIDNGINGISDTVSYIFDNKLMLVLYLVVFLLSNILVFIGVNGWVRNVQTEKTRIESRQIIIANGWYDVDTTELYLTCDQSVQEQNSNFYLVDALSSSDWANICKLSKLKTLSLINCGLSDITGIESLANLQTLNLSQNSISDISSLYSLSNLHTLILQSNNISEVPVNANLTYLDLSDNNIKTLDGISHLTNLEQLFIANNKISNLPFDISNLKKLKKLDISNNLISNITLLNSCSSLRNLYISGNSISNGQLTAFQSHNNKCKLDVEIIQNIPEQAAIGRHTYSTSSAKLILTGEILGYALNDDDLKNMKYFLNLESLNVSGNSITSLDNLSSLYSLTSLDVSYNNVESLDGISRLANLVTLNISHNDNITDLSALNNLTNLKNLYLTKNNFSEETIEILQVNLPDCNIIDES